MNLEVNLVRTSSIDSRMAKFIVRERFKVENDTEALDAIKQFISNHMDTFTASISNKVFLNSLSNLQSLTINELDCLRYVLSVTVNLDIWYWYVSDNETNPTEVPAGIYEYQIVDKSNVVGMFIPFTTKISQSQSDNKLTTLYDQINDMFGFFKSTLFTGIENPLTKMINSIKGDENVLGITSSTKTTYCNAIFDFLKKEIKVITD